MKDGNAEDIGKLILRLCIGGLLLFHGIAKLKSGVDWLQDPLAAYGLPHAVAYGVYLGEVLAPALIIIGLWTRLGAAIVIVNMLFALGLMHMPDFFTLGSGGGWRLELQGFYLLSSLALAFLGAGRISLGGKHGLLN